MCKVADSKQPPLDNVPATGGNAPATVFGMLGCSASKRRGGATPLRAVEEVAAEQTFVNLPLVPPDELAFFH